MSELDFFIAAEPLALSFVATAGDASLPPDADRSRLFGRVASLDRAGPADVTAFMGNEGIDELAATRAGACFVTDRDAAHVPPETLALVCREPAVAIERVAARLFPASLTPVPASRSAGIDADATVHDTARLETGVIVDPGVVIGPGAEIGAGTTIGANSVIGAGVRIGRGAAIDSHVSIRNALIGDRVVVHAGARIGVGRPALDPRAASRRPHLGRVILQDDVEIGANAAIERGLWSDTTIGEGTRIAPLVVVPAGTTTARWASIDGSAFPRL